MTLYFSRSHFGRWEVYILPTGYDSCWQLLRNPLSQLILSTVFNGRPANFYGGNSYAFAIWRVDLDRLLSNKLRVLQRSIDSVLGSIYTSQHVKYSLGCGTDTGQTT